MATWGLIVESTVGTGDHKHTEARVLAQVKGERETALARLEVLARRYSPEHPLNHKRRRLHRSTDGFLLVVDGSWQSHAARFTVAELIEDSAWPAEPDEPKPMSIPAPPVPQPSDERDADGVPLRPAWLGRADLP
ncbi:hypothetical protein [Streptomyces luteireticuli]|uniref:Transposase n=1 Tax=Streptomyces luteireticuli TaxID=173858 RepID=A0ABN0YGL4_9ACTN